jgi:hypothetical protein
MFFLLIFAVIDLGRIYFVQLSIQHALREGGRFAVTGRHLPDPHNPSQNLTRVSSIREIVRQASVGLVRDVQTVQISSDGTSDNAGQPGKPVTLSLTTNLQLVTPLIASFFPNGSYRITAATTFQNEPFPSNQAL